MKNWRVSVTYEYPTQAPDSKQVSVRGTARKAASTGLKEARSAFKGKRPSSIVLLLEVQP